MSKILKDLKATLTGIEYAGREKRADFVETTSNSRELEFSRLNEYRIDCRIGALVRTESKDLEQITQNLYKQLKHEIYNDFVSMVREAQRAVYEQDDTKALDKLMEILELIENT